MWSIQKNLADLATPVAGLLVCLLCLMGAGNPAQKLDQDTAQAEAQNLIQETLDAVITVLKDPSLSSEQEQNQIEQVAFARFDFETISRLVLARNWRRFSEKQRADFLAEFQRHLALTYGETLQNYKDEKIVVDRTRFEKNGDVTVRTKIIGAAADPYLVDYRLRKRNGNWSVIDVIIESVSLVQNFRTQAQEIIADVGPDGLISQLHKKNDSQEKAEDQTS
jgi:phospholipid transport system substrate-binding protein